MVFLRRSRIDGKVSRASGSAARRAIGSDDMFRGADGKARILKIDIFADDAEAAAEFSSAARILDQLETLHAGGKLAFDDFDGGNLGVALVYRGSGRAILGGAPARSPADDLI